MGLDECSGFKLIIKRRVDIIETIKRNITDGDIMDDIIANLETSIAKGIGQEKWTAMPYIGSMRINTRLKSSIANIPKLRAMYNLVPKSQYLVFKKQLAVEEILKEQKNKTVAWLTERAISRCKDKHKKLSEMYGEKYANAYIYFKSLIYPIIEEELDNE